MNRIRELLVNDLRLLVSSLGHAGGLMTPAVYDTAMCLRLLPCADNRPTLQWLSEQQQPDGGWGSLAVPRARIVPSIAAVLALHELGQRNTDREAIMAGMAFVRRAAAEWYGDVPNDLPVGMELLLLRLLHELRKSGLESLGEPLQTQFQSVIDLGMRRRAMLSQVMRGTTAAHSWEAFGQHPDTSLLDQFSSVGHSPAATAAWCCVATNHECLADHIQHANRYLNQAAASTGLDIPNIYPTAWPIRLFEKIFGLHGLLMAGLLQEQELHNPIQAQINDIEQAMRHDGWGFGDGFMSDGDDTGAALAVLASAGRAVTATPLRGYIGQGLCVTYAGELHPSLTTTAHVAHALVILKDPAAMAVLREIVTHQQPSGFWVGDKWNGSPYYTTLQIVAALSGISNTQPSLQCAVRGILDAQHRDGGWGRLDGSTSEETAYALLTIGASC